MSIRFEDAFAAKERRAAIRAEIQNTYGSPCISIAMNIAGPKKTSAEICIAFEWAVSAFRNKALSHSWDIVEERRVYLAAGPFAVIAVNAEALLLKQAAVEIEQSSMAARVKLRRNSDLPVDAFVARLCSGIVERELASLRCGSANKQLTAGERLYIEIGITGIRGEME